jgi:CRP-like cAMP-binding protein
MLASEVTALQNISMFKNVGPAKLKLILLASERTNYRIGESLITEGGSADAVFVILEGKARLMRSDGNVSIQIAEVESGTVVGEMGIVLDRPYSGTIIAETPLIALRIDKRTFLDLLAEVPQFSIALIRELATRLLNTSNLYVKALSK